MSQNQLCLSRRTSRLIIHRFLLLNGLCDISLCVCVCLPSLAGSWTIWSTTWSWKSRTVRAGKATQLASIATGNTWHHSSCSATLRVLTAQSNPQVWSKIRSIQVSMTRQFSQKLIWNFLSFFSQLQDMRAGVWVWASSLGAHEGKPQARGNALCVPGLSLHTEYWFDLMFQGKHSLRLKFCFTDSTGLQLQVLFLLRCGDAFPECPWKHKRPALSLLPQSS